MVNGRPIVEDYVVRDDPYPVVPFSVSVPVRSVFVVGDWRGNPSDSRDRLRLLGSGEIPVDDVVGTVVAADGRLMSPARAFADTGLSGTTSGGSSFREALTGGGGVVAAGGLIWLVRRVRHT